MNKKMNIKDMTLEEKVGQMLMFAFHGYDYSEQLEEQIKDLNVGGVILFAKNIDSDNLERTKELNQKISKSAKYPIFIGLDQEGGMVRRVMKNITPLPGAMTLSATGENIEDICFYEGCELKELGFNMTFAPDSDVNNNPLNPVINSRSYSDDPMVVASYVRQAVRGYRKANIISTLKHFPGHGDTNVDSHLSLPTVTKDLETLENLELLPFREAIKNGECDGIMAAHILYSKIDDRFPATLSHKVIQELLRDKMGYDGFICTDSLTMGAIKENFSYEEIVLNSVNAGIDVLMFCGGAELKEQHEIYDTFLRLVKEGKIKEETVDKSVSRIIKIKNEFLINDAPKINKKYALELSERLFDESVTLVFNKMDVAIKEGEKVLILFPEVKLLTLVDNEKSEYKTLKTFMPEFTEVKYNKDLENLENIAQMAQNYDKIIMATMNVSRGDYQTKVFSVLDKKKTVVCSMRSPYDALYLEGLENYICSYEVGEDSLKALSKALRGEIKFKGKLPVKL